MKKSMTNKDEKIRGNEWNNESKEWKMHGNKKKSKFKISRAESNV